MKQSRTKQQFPFENWLTCTRQKVHWKMSWTWVKAQELQALR